MKNSSTRRYGSRIASRRLAIESLENRLAMALVENGGFESTDLAPWFQFGPNPTVTQVTAPVFAGGQAALVEGRTEEFEGIAQALLGVAADQDYEISAWVRLKSSVATPPLVDNLTLQMIVEDEIGTRFVNVAEDRVTSDGWTQLKGGFRLEASSHPTLVQIDIGKARQSTSYYIDQVEMRAVDWLTAANARIDQHRKRDVVLNIQFANGDPLPARSVEVRQTRQAFNFGSALNANFLNNPQYDAFVRQNFKWVTPENEFKWRFTEPSRDVYDFSTADRFVNYALSRGLNIRGHNIFWGTGDGLPDWIWNTDGSSKLSTSELGQEVNERFRSLLSRYKTSVSHWDVNNESLDLPFFERHLNTAPRSDTHRSMFVKARLEDSDGVLFTNEFGIVDGAGHLGDEYRRLLQRLQAGGAPVGGIGVEAHFDRGISPTAINRGLAHLTDLGLPIWLTEFDVVNPNVNDRARDLEAFMRTGFSTPQVEGILLWGFWAGAHWRGADAALVDLNWNLNAAGQKYLQLMDEWTTEVTGSGPQLAFRGFHGSYEIRITLPGHTSASDIIVDGFELDSSSGAPFVKTIRLPFNDSPLRVTSSADSGPGSLRAAIEYSNARQSPDRIFFDIPGPGVHTINLLSPLPWINHARYLEGSTQAGYTNKPLIEINGSQISQNDVDGLSFNGETTNVNGLAIVGFSGDGIAIYGTTHIGGCYVGISASGVVKPNGGSGIRVQRGSLSQIGVQGEPPNVISGNRLHGIHLNRLSSKNTIANNFIGLDPTGQTAVPNAMHGILVQGADNLFGDFGTGPDNYIAGNGASGMVFLGDHATGNEVIENQIGTTSNGLQAVPNQKYGVEFQNGARENLLVQSLISGNMLGGVLIQGGSTTRNRVAGNNIGLNVSRSITLGSQPVGISLLAPGNTLYNNTLLGNTTGIRLGLGAESNAINKNWIGTDAADANRNLGNQTGILFANGALRNFVAENQIKYNQVGIQAESQARENRLTRNSIALNLGMGIDLNGEGITPNDPGDADGGANQLQNFPSLASATLSGETMLEITYRVDTLPANAAFPLRIEFFLSDGSREGRLFLDQDVYTAAQAQAGNKTIVVPVDSSQWPAIPSLVATATDSAGNTSEFSQLRTVVFAAAIAALGQPSVSSFRSSLDVNVDGFVTPLDALLVVNEINQTHGLPERITRPSSLISESLAYDANVDSVVSALDALLIIDWLNVSPSVPEPIDLLEDRPEIKKKHMTRSRARAS